MRNIVLKPSLNASIRLNPLRLARLNLLSRHCTVQLLCNARHSQLNRRIFSSKSFATVLACVSSYPGGGSLGGG